MSSISETDEEFDWGAEYSNSIELEASKRGNSSRESLNLVSSSSVRHDPESCCPIENGKTGKLSLGLGDNGGEAERDLGKMISVISVPFSR